MLLFKLKYNKKYRQRIIISAILIILIVIFIGYNITNQINTKTGLLDTEEKNILNEDEIEEELETPTEPEKEEQIIEEPITEEVIEEPDIEEIVVNPKPTHKDEGTEITNINILKDLSNDIDELLGKQRIDEFKQITYYNTFTFRHWFLKRKLTLSDKQYIVLETAPWEEITGTSWKNIPGIQLIVDSQMKYGKTEQEALKGQKQQSADKINKESLRIFGINMPNLTETRGKCPTYAYDKQSNMYFAYTGGCGGAGRTVAKGYKSSFREVGDLAYVYVSFAHFKFNETQTKTEIKVYRDYKMLDETGESYIHINRYKTTPSVTNLDTFVLDSTNYQDFSEYEFTFKKDSNNNYYFIDVEQIK